MEIRAVVSILDRLVNAVRLPDLLPPGVFGPRLRRLARRGVIGFSRRFPRTYLAFVTALAATGYVFILVFPYLLLSMPGALSELVPVARTPGEWLLCGAQAVSLIVGGVFTYTLCALRFEAPGGRPLAREEAPRLFEMLTDLTRAYGKPRIHAVVLDEGSDIRIVHTPRTGWPLGTRRTLVIGLPVLQTMGTQHLRALLARRIGQLAGRNRALDTWLRSLNDVWQRYAAIGDEVSGSARVIVRFFRLYAPLYRAVSLGAAYRAELRADRCVLDIINAQEAVEAISLHAAVHDFLQRRYWPTLQRLAARNGGTELFPPYRHLTDVVCKGLAGRSLGDSVVRLHDEDNEGENGPGLGERLENIGYAGPIPLQLPRSTAGSELLGQALPAIVAAFDECWGRARLKH